MSSFVFVTLVLSCVCYSGPLLCSLQWSYLVFVTVVLVTAHPLQDSDKSTFIVGGKTSAKGRWPWQLSLQVIVTLLVIGCHLSPS